MSSDILLNILKTLEQYHHSKDDLIVNYIQNRLNKNLSVYYKQLSQSVQFLEQRNSKSVLSKLKG